MSKTRMLVYDYYFCFVGGDFRNNGKNVFTIMSAAN